MKELLDQVRRKYSNRRRNSGGFSKHPLVHIITVSFSSLTIYVLSRSFRSLVVVYLLI